MKKKVILLAAIIISMTGVGWAAGTFLVPESIKNAPVVHEASLDSVKSDHGEEPVDDHGELESKDDGHGDEPKEPEPIVVELGRIMVPIYQPRVITYVIADMGVSLMDEKKAEEFKSEKGTAKIKNDILSHMISMSEKGAFSGSSVDTEYLSYSVQRYLNEMYPEIDHVLFLSLIKQDVARGA